MKLPSMISSHIGANLCFCGSSIFKYDGFSLASIAFLLLLLSAAAIHPVGAQSAPPSGSQDDAYYNNKFSPSMGVIIIILISALFFMGFFSIYIRHCSEDSSTSPGVRNPGSVARSRRNQRGLDPTVIESFPTFEYSAVRSLHIGKGALECAVCLNEFENDETLRLIPKCDHVFHPECIDAWLVAHTTCPVCRANLVPLPGESVHAAPELGQISEHNRHQEGVVVDVPDQLDGSHHQSMNNVDEESMEQPLHAPPPLSELANFSTRRLNRNRTRRNISGRPKWFDRFSRSNSTGHVAVKQWENLERFTLRVPEQVRRQIMSGKLSRSTSLVGLPRESSSRRGYRPGFGGGVGEGSSRGGRFSGRLDRYASRSDRWVFSLAPPFLSRMPSLKSPRMAAPSRNGSVHSKGDSVHAPKVDAASKIANESDRLPV